MNAKRPLCAAPAPNSPAPAASQTYHYATLEQSGDAATVLAEEVALAIAYNGISQAVMLVTPTDLEDFIVGFSLGSGIIDNANDIYDLKLTGAGSAQYAHVEIASRAFWNLKQQRRQLAGTSGCGLCGVEAVEQALPDLKNCQVRPYRRLSGSRGYANGSMTSNRWANTAAPCMPLFIWTPRVNC